MPFINDQSARKQVSRLPPPTHTHRAQLDDATATNGALLFIRGAQCLRIQSGTRSDSCALDHTGSHRALLNGGADPYARRPTAVSGAATGIGALFESVRSGTLNLIAAAAAHNLLIEQRLRILKCSLWIEHRRGDRAEERALFSKGRELEAEEQGE